MNVGLVYDPVYLKHDTGQHVENAGRLQAVLSHLEQTGLMPQLTLIKPRAASTEEIALVHQKQYISRIHEVAEKGGGWLDADTVTSSDSYQAAIYAAGGVITATEAVINGEVGSAFALVRPPGHHAIPRQAMGFCLFNNVAIAAKYALDSYVLERILIIDFDVHHGNGTQAAFYDDPQRNRQWCWQGNHAQYPATRRLRRCRIFTGLRADYCARRQKVQPPAYPGIGRL